MKILIGYDGSQYSDEMLLDLNQAGLPKTAEVKVLSVGELWLAPPTEDENSPLFDLETPRKLSEQARRKLVEMFPSWHIEAVSEVGSPAVQLLGFADEWKPDLLVVGSHGRSALERLFFGSVSLQVVTGAHCSVRVARKPRNEPGSPVKIVIGLDGSTEAKAAVEAVASRCWPANSEVTLVTSINPYAIDSTNTHSQDTGVNLKLSKTAELYAYAQSIQNAASEHLRLAGLTVNSVISEESPKKSILHSAEKLAADAIFVGSRGLGMLRRLLLGSVSSAVVARAHCSVEVIRRLTS
ncbi:MAG: universal stress protein [Acidobacteriota bacterium]|nr:universal stress protein [Blastocatellia bacterium]MDW8413072.1 universal stress protein [Acidobacteriota bacterium]